MSLYIFDKDLTLVEGVGGRPPNTIDEQVLLPNVADVCAALKEDGHILALASNQGGVAFGFMEPEAAREIMQHAADAIKAVDFEVCFYHPSGRVEPFNQESDFRKPNPGMLLALMERLGFSREDTIYIGDMETDREAAERAGIQFVWAKDFFGFE